MFENTAITALNLAGKLPDLLRSAKSDSLIEYSKPTRVEPLCIVDDRIPLLPYANDLMQTLTSIFSAYYLQAVAISVNVGKVDVIKLLDKLNPSRSPSDSLITTGTSLLSTESYRHQLPRAMRKIGMEAFNDPTVKDVQAFGKDTVKTITENTNLCVGKMLEVQIESDGHKASFPIAVRLIVNTIDQTTLAHTLAVGSKDQSVKERWHSWRAGQLEFIRDLVLCQDLIDEHRTTLMHDKGFYAETMARRNKNRLSAIVSGSPSVATASNMVVITESTAKAIEREVNGRLKDHAIRERIFKNTYVMIMVVVDTEWEQITIYHRSLERPTQLSVKELKSTSRGTGPDVAEILKAYQLGNAPSL